jgi:hypothetical protein
VPVGDKVFSATKLGEAVAALSECRSLRLRVKCHAGDLNMTLPR